MMRGDGFQCDIPDPTTENLLRAMLQTGEQASGRSKKRMSMQRDTSDADQLWTGQKFSTNPDLTKLTQCELPNRWRYGDRGTEFNLYAKGCPNEPTCCRNAKAANPEDGCNCSCLLYTSPSPRDRG